MAELRVEVLSPAKVVGKMSAERVQLPGILGEMGILPGHAALTSELGLGMLDIIGSGAGNDKHYFVSGGYVEVAEDLVRVLVDTIERVDEIDINRAEAARKRAEERLEKKEGIDVVRAQAALQRSMARLALVAKYRK